MREVEEWRELINLVILLGEIERRKRQTSRSKREIKISLLKVHSREFYSK